MNVLVEIALSNTEFLLLPVRLSLSVSFAGLELFGVQLTSLTFSLMFLLDRLVKYAILFSFIFSVFHLFSFNPPSAPSQVAVSLYKYWVSLAFPFRIKSGLSNSLEVSGMQFNLSIFYDSASFE